TSTSPILFTVVFSEAVSGFTFADISFTGSTAGGTLLAAVSGSGPTYSVSVTGMTTDGSVSVRVPAAAAADAAGNLSAVSNIATCAWIFPVAPTTQTYFFIAGQY